MAALVQPDIEGSLISDAIASVTPPKGVRLKAFSFDEDHTGAPALRVVFAVSKKIPLTRPRVRELAEFTMAVSDKLWALPTRRVPYVTLEDAR